MRFDLTDEQKLLQESVRRFAEKDYGFEKRRARVKAGDAFDPQVWKTFGAMGWLSIMVPEADGGLGPIGYRSSAGRRGTGTWAGSRAVCGLWNIATAAARKPCGSETRRSGGRGGRRRGDRRRGAQ